MAETVTEKANVSPEHEGEFGYGDVWTWVALDADTKLAVSWLVGDRDLEAVDAAFGTNIDYATLVKLYGQAPESERRYSPPVCVGTLSAVISGDPDRSHISTSYVERQNLTMRMSMRRFTRLTNGFSKEVENLAHAVALHFLYYNFARPHKSLNGKTPAMAAGLTDHTWDIMELTAMVEIWGEEGVKSSSSN